MPQSNRPFPLMLEWRTHLGPVAENKSMSSRFIVFHTHTLNNLSPDVGRKRPAVYRRITTPIQQITKLQSTYRLRSGSFDL
jgi:hypothetical protein